MPYQYDPVLTSSVVGREQRQSQLRPYSPAAYNPHPHHQPRSFDVSSLYASNAAARPSASPSNSGGTGGSGGEIPSALWGQLHLSGSHTDSNASSPDIGSFLSSSDRQQRWDSPVAMSGVNVPPATAPQLQQGQPQPTWPYQLNSYNPVDTGQWQYENKGHEQTHPYTRTLMRSHPSTAAQHTTPRQPYDPEYRAPPVTQPTVPSVVRPPNPPKSGRLGVKRRQKYTRSRTGCLGCRARRIKCDEGRPVCRRCQIAKRECLFPEEAGGGKKDDRDHHHHHDDDDEHNDHQPAPRQFDLSHLPALDQAWGVGKGYTSNILPNPTGAVHGHHHHQLSLDSFHLEDLNPTHR